MEKPFLVYIRYWSCGCITWDHLNLAIDHSEHQGAYIVAWEKRYVELNG